MPFTLKASMCGPRVYVVHCLEACFRGMLSKAQASRQLYKIDGGLVMEMVKHFLGTLQMVAHLFRKIMGKDFTIFMCYYILVFHESQCLLAFLSWGFFPKNEVVNTLERFCYLNKLRTYVKLALTIQLTVLNTFPFWATYVLGMSTHK